MQQDIPGYFFDTIKGKYFKIQPSFAVPFGAEYSKENVKKKRREAEQQQDEHSRQGGRVRPKFHRASILNEPQLGRIALRREIGDKPFRAHESGRTAVFAQGLEGDTLLDLGVEQEVTSFVRDGATGGMFAGTNSHQRPGLYSATEPKQVKGDPNRAQLIFAPQSEVRSHLITSVDLTNTRTLISTFLGTTSTPSIHLTKLLPAPQINSTFLDTGIHVLLRPSKSTPVFTSAISPIASSGTIAIGTGSGIILIQETPSFFQPTSISSNTDVDGLDLDSSRRPALATYDWHSRSIDLARHLLSDVLALAFRDDNTLLAGQRGGGVLLLDTREVKALRSSNVILRHPGAVTGIRMLDEHRVVLNGLPACVCAYDLRRPHPPSPSPAFPQPTQPIIVYDGHDNAYRTGLGFDVDHEVGLLAAGREDGGISVWDLHSGERIAIPGLGPNAVDGQAEQARYRCLRFERGRYRNGGPWGSTLLASKGGLVEEYVW